MLALTCVKTVETVPGVGVVVGLRPLEPYVVHDLVLAFAGGLVTRQDDLAALPKRVRRDLARNEVLKLLVQSIHEAEKGINFCYTTFFTNCPSRKRTSTLAS